MRFQLPTTVFLFFFLTIIMGCGDAVVGGACAESYTACRSGCYNLELDEGNCGECGHTCPNGETCLGGKCGKCELGESECSGVCVDIAISRSHCGGCDQACGKKERCEAGVCKYCPDDTLMCANECIDSQNNSAHCGGCDAACEGDETCVEGECILECEPPDIPCGSECVDISSNRHHCGSCFTECPPAWPTCVERRCAGACPEWMVLCAGECVNQDVDPRHCGGCNEACPEDAPSCFDGECVPTCPEPMTKCGDRCVLLDNDPDHCGECFNGCADPNVLCSDGECVQDCGPGADDCSGACVSLYSNNLHCGACGAACGADEICIKGHCEIKCAESYIDCGYRFCINPNTDWRHCGGCETRCGSAEVCFDGECTPNCGVLDWCNGRCADLARSNIHCGSCNTPCDGYCVGGKCQSECPEPWVLCGEMCIDPKTDPYHCGGCDNLCESGVCSESVCREESAGHLVAIGHDFSVGYTALRRMVGNSVFMSPTPTVKLLAFDEYVDTSSGIVDAVSQSLALSAEELGREYEVNTVSTVEQLKAELLQYDVLLVYPMVEADDGVLTDYGHRVMDRLRSFLMLGGVVIFIDAQSQNNSGTSVLFNAAGVFSCSGIVDATGSTAEVIGLSDAVAQGLGASYLASENSVFFVTTESNVVSRDRETLNPFVVHKSFFEPL